MLDVHFPLIHLTGRCSVQPAAESRHLQRHRDESHVWGMLLPIAAKPMPSCFRRAYDPLVRLTLLAGRGCFQPASEFQHVQHHLHGWDVRGASTFKRQPCTRAYLVSEAYLFQVIPDHFLAWQNALVFNQSLCFETSSVRDMGWMFGVRSACPASS